MTIDDAIKIVDIKASGRTRYKGQRPFLDEILVKEIKSLRRKLEVEQKILEKT